MTLRLLISCLLGLFIGVNATAQSADDKARSLFLEAEKNYQAGNYAQSLTQLQMVNQLLGRPTPRIQYLVVKTLVGQQQWQQANTELTTYRQLNDNNAERKNEIEQLSQTISEKLSAISVTLQTPTSVVTAPLPGTAPQTTPSPPVSREKPTGVVAHPKRIGLKVGIGFVTVGAGIYALSLNSQFTSKLQQLNEISRATSPNGDGLILNQADYDRWRSAYTNAQAAQSKNGLFNICIGAAVLATLADAYLLIHKPKKTIPKLSWHPTATAPNWGLALHYSF